MPTDTGRLLRKDSVPCSVGGYCLAALCFAGFAFLVTSTCFFIARVVGHGYLEAHGIWGSAWLAVRDGGAAPMRAVLDNSIVGNVLLLFHWATAYGAFVVAAMLLLSRWNPKRCFAFVGVGVLVPAAFMLQKHYLNAGHLAETSSLQLNWIHLWIKYPPYAVPIGLVVGWAAALLPIFRPGPQYWLARGMCPQCQYILRGDTDAGCPECGWNRDDDHATDPATST